MSEDTGVKIRSSMKVDRILSWISMAVIILFMVLYAWNSMQDFVIKLMNYGPDNPVFNVIAFKNPFILMNSVVYDVPAWQIIPIKIIASALNWIPFALWYFGGIPAYSSTWVLSLLQGLLIGLSVYSLARSCACSQLTAFFCVVFAYAATPWNWSGANYGAPASWNFYPYAGTFVVPVVLFAFALLLKKRVIPVLLLLTLAGLMHPALALSASATVGIYWLAEGVRTRSWRVVVMRVIGIGWVVLIFMLPTLKDLLSNSSDALPVATSLRGLNLNMHIGAWQYSFSLRVTLGWILLSLMAWRWRSRLSRDIWGLWLAAWAAGIIFSISQYLGGYLGIPLLLTLIGLRAVSWASLLALPVVMVFLLEKIQSGNWLAAFLSLLCLVLPVYGDWNGLYYLLIFALILLEVSEGRFFLWKFNLPPSISRWLYGVALLVSAGWSLGFFAYPVKLNFLPEKILYLVNLLIWTNFVPIEPPPFMVRVALWVVIALFVLLVIRAKLISRIGNLWGFDPDQAVRGLLTGFLVLYSGFFLLIHWQPPADYASNPTLNLQLWIRDHLPQDATLLMNDSGWETISERATMSSTVRLDYNYAPTRQVNEYRQKVLELYGLSFEDLYQKHWSNDQLRDVLHQKWDKFTSSDFQKFYRTFGVTYLVLGNTRAKNISLPVIYQDGFYTIFSLKEGS